MKKQFLAVVVLLLSASVMLYAAWDSHGSSTQLTTISDTYQYFDDTITTTPGESCHIQVTVDYAGTTDDAELIVITTLDDSSETWDSEEAPYIHIGFGRAVDPEVKSFWVSGVYRFKVGVQSTGSTDDHTDADMEYRCNGIDAS